MEGLARSPMYAVPENAWWDEHNIRPPAETSISPVHSFRTELQPGPESREVYGDRWKTKRKPMVSA